MFKPETLTPPEQYARAKRVSETLHRLYPKADKPETIAHELKVASSTEVRHAAQRHRDAGGRVEELSEISKRVEDEVNSGFERIRPVYRGR